MDRWLFQLRLPPSEHRILELLIESADAEDGCSWPSYGYMAHWAAMTERNVIRVVKKLVEKEVLQVWVHGRRSNTYQVQCPELSKLEDRSRAEKVRGVNLSGDNMSGDNLSGGGDKSGAETEANGDKLSEKGVTDCPAEELQQPEELPTTEQDQEGTASSEPPAASEAEAAGGSGNGKVYTVWDEDHPNPCREKGDDTPVVILIPLSNSDERPFAVTEKLLARWEDVFPGVDVPDALRRIRLWAFDNSKKRKTPDGIKKHITTWLAGNQDDGVNQALRPPPEGRARVPSKSAQAVSKLKGMANEI